MNRLLTLLPRAFRGRYGDELSELLAESSHPRRDSLNVLALVFSLQMEAQVTRLNQMVRISGFMLIMFGIFASGYAMNDLNRGLAEANRHWWTTAPVIFVLAGAAVLHLSARLGCGRGQDSPRI